MSKKIPSRIPKNKKLVLELPYYNEVSLINNKVKNYLLNLGEKNIYVKGFYLKKISLN